MTEVLIALLFVFVLGGLFIGALQLIKTIASLPINITVTHVKLPESPPVASPIPEIDKATQAELEQKATFDSVITALNDIMTGGDK